LSSRILIPHYFHQHRRHHYTSLPVQTEIYFLSFLFYCYKAYNNHPAAPITAWRTNPGAIAPAPDPAALVLLLLLSVEVAEAPSLEPLVVVSDPLAALVVVVAVLVDTLPVLLPLVLALVPVVVVLVRVVADTLPLPLLLPLAPRPGPKVVTDVKVEPPEVKVVVATDDWVTDRMSEEMLEIAEPRELSTLDALEMTDEVTEAAEPKLVGTLIMLLPLAPAAGVVPLAAQRAYGSPGYWKLQGGLWQSPIAPFHADEQTVNNVSSCPH